MKKEMKKGYGFTPATARPNCVGVVSISLTVYIFLVFNNGYFVRIAVIYYINCISFLLIIINNKTQIL